MGPSASHSFSMDNHGGVFPPSVTRLGQHCGQRRTADKATDSSPEAQMSQSECEVFIQLPRIHLLHSLQMVCLSESGGQLGTCMEPVWIQLVHRAISQMILPDSTFTCTRVLGLFDPDDPGPEIW